MKKILPLLGAALSLGALQPVTAQTASAEAGSAFAETVIPVLFDQLDQVIGISPQRLLSAEGTYEVKPANLLYYYKPDSLHLNIENLLTSRDKSDKLAEVKPVLNSFGIDLTAVPIYFSEYKAMSLRDIQVDFDCPTQIKTSSPLGDVILTLDWEPYTHNQMIGSFSAFSCEIELTGVLANIATMPKPEGSADLSWLKSGSVFVYRQTYANNIAEFTMNYGDVGMGINALIKGEERANVSRVVVHVDYSPAAQGYYTKTTYYGYLGSSANTKVKEELIYKPSAFILADDSVVTTNYDLETGRITGYEKVEKNIKSATDEMGRYVYQIKSTYQKEQSDDDWGSPVSQDSIRYQAHTPIAPDNLYRSILTAISAALRQGISRELPVYAQVRSTYVEGQDGYNPVEAKTVTLSKGFSVAGSDSITLVLETLKPVTDPDDGLEYYPIHSLESGFVSDGTGSARYLTNNEDAQLLGDGDLFTIYYHSNLTEHVDNAIIAPKQQLQIQQAMDRLVFVGVDKAAYTIYDATGRIVRHSTGADVPLQGLQRGHIYTVLAIANGEKALLRFVR